MPSTRTLIFPSGSLRLWTMFAIVPTLKISSGRGSSTEASCCVARKIFLSAASASSKARTLDSRPTTKGVIIYGKITTSRIGIMGKRRVSDFSLEVSIEELFPGSRSTVHFVELRNQINKQRANGSASLLQQRHVYLLRDDHFLGDQELADLLIRREIIHQIQHQVFEDHPQTPCTNLALHGERSNSFQSVVAKLQSNIFEFEKFLILADDGVLGFGEDLDQGFLTQVFQNCDHGHAADELGDKAEPDEIHGLNVFEQIHIAALRAGAQHSLGAMLLLLDEAHGLGANALGYHFFQADKRAATNEKDVRSIDRGKFLMRMFPST